MNSSRALWVLLVVAAAARLMLQAAAMPPYAGLDEVYHVGVLRYVAAEGRMPRMGAISMPRYLALSIGGDAAALPAFGVVGAGWPQLVSSRPNVLVSRNTTADLRPYSGTNYEAQQPALYYRIAAPLAAAATSPRTELRLWRLFSIICALLVVLSAALIGRRFFGDAGLLAAVLLVSLPTWETLVVRASNDALACALLAMALAVTIAGRSPAAADHLLWHVAEAMLWAGAIAVKLYSWPVVVVLPLIWRTQRAPLWRWVVVSSLIAASALLTVADLHSRTNNPLGLFAFDTPGSGPARAAVPIDYATMVKVFVATFAWTSGQHWDALRPAAIALYLLPPLAIVSAAVIRHGRVVRREIGWCAVIVAVFAAAQWLNVAGYVRLARAAGSSMPAGGKEGWYWYALAPLIGTLALGMALDRLSRVGAIALIAWIVIWDVLITEGALFHDYAGTTSSLHPSILFRWGPLLPPFTADLTAVGVGPFAAATVVMRLVHLAVLALMVLMASRRVSAVAPAA